MSYCPWDKTDSILNSLQLIAFDRFYEAYGYKKSKKNAKVAWKKINPELYDLIIANAQILNDNSPVKDYYKHPATWLNGECWEDEVVPLSRPEPEDKEPELSQDELIAMFTEGE